MARPRRDYGSGSIVEDKHGQIWAKIEIGGGKLRRARCATRAEADRTLKRWRQEQEAGVNLRTARLSLKAWLERWLSELKVAETVKPSTLKFYIRHADYAVPHIGHLALEELTADDWRSARTKLLKTSLSRRSINHIHSVLHNALERAVSDHALARNPLASVERLPLGDQEFEAHVLSDDEITAFVDACAGERLGTFFCFILDHGLRNGEARNLKRTDLCLDATDRHGEPTPHFFVRVSKSKAGRRRMPLTTSWTERMRVHLATIDGEKALAERKAVQQAKQTGVLTPLWRDQGYVFPSEVGSQLGEQNVNKVKQRILQRAKLCDPCAACGATGKVTSQGSKVTRCETCLGRGVILWKIRVHDLRHTAITDWVAAVGDPKAAQTLAGHSDPGVTMKIYAKGREEKQRDTLERTEEARQERRKKAGGE